MRLLPGTPQALGRLLLLVNVFYLHSVKGACRTKFKSGAHKQNLSYNLEKQRNKMKW